MIFLVRLAGEIAVKSNTVRVKFVNQLVSNLHSAFLKSDVKAVVKKTWSRIYVESGDDRCADILKTIFGVQSFSPVDFVTESDLEKITQASENYYRSVVTGQTFAVKARRSGKVGFTSMDANRAVGAALNKVPSASVDLSSPGVVIELEIQDDQTYFYHKVIPGAGGMPLGTGGRAVVLMSGGFDSPVAAWMLQKRGVKVDYLFCNLAGASYERSVLEISKYLYDRWGNGSRSRFAVVPFEKVLDELKAKVEPKFVQLILKRLFYRVAEKFARRVGASAIITGEAVGQVSSQTLKNLAAIDGATSLPVLRPLVAFDKNEINELSRKIGTYEFSAKVNEYCHVSSGKPITACSAEKASFEESKFDLAVLEDAAENATLRELRKVKLSEIVKDFILVDHVPENAQVIDTRPEDLFEEWHYPGAKNIEAFYFYEKPKMLEKGKTYILYCPYGLQSAVAAEKMQSLGYEVYSFRGGVDVLKKTLKSSDNGSK